MKKSDVEKYLKRSDITIEGNVATWSISAHGNVGGTYIGTFKFKCFLTPTEKLAAGRLYRELLGPNATLAFKNEDNLAFSLAQLRYRIITAPAFWSSAIGINEINGDLPDENVIDAVLEAAVTSELKYAAQLQVEKEELLKQAQKRAESLLDVKDEAILNEDSDD